jgi:hypothetical protein
MAIFTTTEEARRHMRWPVLAGSPAPDDVDLQAKLDAAEDLVLAFVARPNDADRTAEIAAWAGSPSTVPAIVKLAILMQCADLCGHRGDERLAQGGLAPEVEAMLRAGGQRDYVMA